MSNLPPLRLHAVAPDLTDDHSVPWMRDALCSQVDPGIFHPEGPQAHYSESIARTAIGVCRRCPVTAECLSWALEVDDRFGVLGGTTPSQRAQMRRGA